MIAKSKYNPYRKKEKPEFTARELEVVELVCREMSNKEIAEKLFLSIRTVEGLRLKIAEKMNVKNPVGMVLYAMKNGLVKF